MATATPALDTLAAGRAGPFTRPAELGVGRAPLVLAALALTAGIVLDRYIGIPWVISLILAVAALVAWLVTRQNSRPGLPLVYLALSAAGVSAAYHHGYREFYAADNIGWFATPDPRPVHVRGVLVEEPVIRRRPRHDPLASIPQNETTTSVIEVQSLRSGDEWPPVSGKAQLVVAGHLLGFHAGDEVEVVGRLSAPSGPANLGGFDYAGFLRDQRIRATIAAQKTPDAVVRLSEGGPKSFGGWLGWARGWGQRAIQQALPEEQSRVATALLLGEGSTMTTDDWEKYVRTGVVHILAVSGQHLTVLALFLWFMLRAVGVRRRRGALVVAGLLLGYALLTGGRPAALRAAVMVCAVCGGIYLRRPVSLANTFALSWLVVALLDPTDLAGVGCQLSFLAVAVLYWVGFHLYRQPTSASERFLQWFRARSDPLERLVEETWPAWQRALWWLARQVVSAYAVTLAIWLAVAPLIAARLHIFSPVGILIGPPTVLLASAALLAGFLLLLATAFGGPLVPALAWVMRTCL